MSRPRRDQRPTGPAHTDAARQDRIATDIHAVLAQTLREDVKDPRVAALSITAVRLSTDLSIAHVNVVPLGGQGDAEVLLAGLEAAAGFLRRAIGRQVRLRHTPELRFHLDEGIDESLRMSRLLGEMEDRRGEGPPAGDDDDGEGEA